ncbi:MAG: serine hydrolase, partial [Sphingobacteriales bacterium]
FAILFILLSGKLYAQQIHFKQEKDFSKALLQIVQQAGLDSSFKTDDILPEHVSIALIDITNKKPVLAGVNMDSFIYPASVYKMYVAMEVLKQVSEGKYSLQTNYIVKSPNDVDRSREVSIDPRPLLRKGDTVTINYLLDLMITRSDNSASNCLIDIAGRKNMNETILDNGWKGSEVTRKFLIRKLEDPGYDSIRGTVTNARHAAEFLYKVATNTLINPWVSLQLKALLGRQLDKTKLATGFPGNTMFSHKSGWWSYYTHDAGIVEDGKIKYILAVFTPVKESQMNGRLKTLAQKIHTLLQQRHH